MNKMRLYTPGPTSVPEDVLLEMAKPVFHHRTQQYKDLFAKVNELLKYTFQTKNPVLTISGSGTAGAEMAMINSIPPNGTVLFLSNGKFAERWVKIGERNKWNATVLKADYGTAVSPDQVADALKQKHYDAVVLVHSETSACTVTDLQAIAALTRNTDTVLISDGITAIGALPVKTDEWGVDIVITGSQKALMLPPGLAFISVSEKAQKRAAAVKQPNLYLDVNSYLKSYEANDVPWTPAVTLVRGLHSALTMIQLEGIENVWKRTSAYAAATRAAANALGLGVFSKQPSDSVTGINYPAGFTDKDFRGALRKQLNMNIAAGQGTMEGKIFRISHMGYVDQVDTLGVIHGLEIILKQQGYKFDFGAGVAAAHKELAKLQEK
ncbi:MAG TPA: alanine--glyoxylate aminotransferase family protein [Phycisphaerae bacterium]|nr:alanine--glyoxylate aminotransferase family protein [Phycisphaerae bacterium]